MLVAIAGEDGAMLHASDDERRARLAVRHALAPAYRVDSSAAATRAMTVLHATDAATVYLSSWARVESLRIADVDSELYEQRSLVRCVCSTTRCVTAHEAVVASVANGRALGPEWTPRGGTATGGPSCVLRIWVAGPFGECRAVT